MSESIYSCQIMDYFYEKYKEFIVLGLCGKTGSGVTTAADILNSKSFEELCLPKPGYSSGDIYQEHEYRILYTYAHKNWDRFYKIKTSALISRHILSENVEIFLEFVKKLGIDFKEEDIRWRKCVDRFFNASMEIDLMDYVLEIAPFDLELAYALLKEDGNTENNIENERQAIAAAGNRVSINEKRSGEKERCICRISDDVTIQFSYQYSMNEHEMKAVCKFRNTDLSKMLDCYKKLRENKEGFQNPYFCWILEKYIYEFLPLESKKMWEEIAGLSNGSQIVILQCLGNNLRLARKPYLSDNNIQEDFKKNGYTYIAEDVNLAIKVLRASQYGRKILGKDNQKVVLSEEDRRESDSVRTVVVVDSIKNPYESMYLKQRYNNYFLIGIYTEDSERYHRIRKKNPYFNEDILEVINTIEQVSELNKKLRGETEVKKELLGKVVNYLNKGIGEEDLHVVLPFVSQNISQCLEGADIFINNVREDASYNRLKKILLRYVCLIKNPGLVLPTNVERCMQTAYISKMNSGCISRQVGAVITDSEYHLLSTGWNQQPEGQLPCSYRDLYEVHYHWSPEAYSDYENDDDGKFQKYIKKLAEKFFSKEDKTLRDKGKLPCFCFKDIYNCIKMDKNQVHTRALHGEETAFLNLSRVGIHLLENGILFTTSSPCELCSKKAMYLGIKKIYYIEPYFGLSQSHVLSAGKKEKRPEFILFTGAIGEAYTQLYMPVMPRKDENELWCGKQIEKMIACNDNLEHGKEKLQKENDQEATEEGG